jgi:hypothetical protein
MVEGWKNGGRGLGKLAIAELADSDNAVGDLPVKTCF